MSLYSRLSIRQKHIAWAWAFLAIPVLFYVVIRFYPTSTAFIISFQEWNLLSDPTWVGWDNYIKLWNDPVFWIVFSNTFEYLIIGTPVSLLISFVIAYHLDKLRFMHGFLRMLYFLPFMTSAVAMAWVWRWFYQDVPIGLFNNLLASIGIPQISFSIPPPMHCCPCWHPLFGQVGFSDHYFHGWPSCHTHQLL